VRSADVNGPELSVSKIRGPHFRLSRISLPLNADYSSAHGSDWRISHIDWLEALRVRLSAPHCLDRERIFLV
jgi:hypothetical protein